MRRRLLAQLGQARLRPPGGPGGKVLDGIVHSLAASRQSLGPHALADRRPLEPGLCPAPCSAVPYCTRLTAVITGGLVGMLTSPAPLLTTCTARSAAKVVSLLTSAVVITVPKTA